MQFLDQVSARMCWVLRRACQPKSIFWLAPLVFFWLAFLAWMRPLHIPDEGRYVGVAWDMVRFDSTWTPLLNGLPYFHKPPLFYWLNEFSFILLGANEFAARMPSLVIGWITAMALFVFVRRHRGPEIAVVSLLVLLTNPYFYGASQYANLDMMVAGMMSLTIMAAAEAVSRLYHGQDHARLFAMAAGVLAALAVLSKGLIGVVLPGAILVAWLLFNRRWRGFALLLSWPVWLSFLLVAAPWFIAMEIRYPGFLNYFFIYQHFERFVSSGFNQQKPLWFFIPVILGFMLPWSVWLVRYLFSTGEVVKDKVWFSLMLFWVLIIVVFFSIPTSKLIGYTVPVVPALSVLIAEVVVASWTTLSADRNIRLSVVTAISGVILCLGALVGFMFANDHSTKSTVQAMEPLLKSDDRFVMLDMYPFDLSFYTKSPYQTWVVFDWPNLPAGDNWRNELQEAGEFDPERVKGVLVEPKDLLLAMCHGPNRTYWIGAYMHEADRWPWLKDREYFYQKRNGETFWKVDVNAPFRQQWCGEDYQSGESKN